MLARDLPCTPELTWALLVEARVSAVLSYANNLTSYGQTITFMLFEMHSEMRLIVERLMFSGIKWTVDEVVRDLVMAVFRLGWGKSRISVAVDRSELISGALV